MCLLGLNHHRPLSHLVRRCSRSSVACRCPNRIGGSPLFAVLDLPGGTFTGAGVKTVVLFFEKGKPTKNIWYYQLNLDRNLGKTNPLNENDLAEFVKLQKTNGDSDNSWTVNIKDVDQTSFDLSVKNPNKDDEVVLREPEEILDEIAQLDSEASEILETIRGLV